MNQKTMLNSLYCIITTSGNEHLDDAFTAEIRLYLDPDDYYCCAGYDVGNESIYFIYIDQWKVFQIIDFFKRNNILLHYQVVQNVIDFIDSDKKFLEVYSDEHNKTVVNNYIMNSVSVDDVLDRINDNRNNKEFSLLPIERSILGFDFA